MSGADKSELRRTAAAVRAQLAETDSQGQATGRIISRLLEVLNPQPGDIVAAFMPVRSEINLTPLFPLLSDRGCPVVLPHVVAIDQPLAFYRWRAGQPLAPGAFGVPVPTVDGEALRPDIVLTPMLAFDRRGYRLGYGGGFYDRTLAALRASGTNPSAVGPAWAGQQLAVLPVDSHDQRLDIIVTEKEVIRP